MTNPQKITFGEMCESGVRDVLIYCRDHRCSHSTTISADQWSDNIRLSGRRARLRLHRLRAPWCRGAAEVFAGVAWVVAVDHAVPSANSMANCRASAGRWRSMVSARS